MIKMDAGTIAYYDLEVVKLMSEKYALDPMTALERFVKSETHVMLCNPEMEMCQFGPPALFDLWEVEQITGDPRNSVYIRA